MLLDTNELQVARLIPTSGIGGAREQERRATSALLAVLTSVQEFGKAVTQSAGAPAGKIQCYTEVPFKLGTQSVRPDGVITVSRGKRTWSALVEVKTGRNPLRPEQIETYLDVAKQYRVDAVITISNQIAPDDGFPPILVDRRKTRSIRLKHLSWVDLITLAVMERDHRGVSDPDQAWILGELIAYLEHPNSGALQFDDMGEHWTSIAAGSRDGTLRMGDPGVDDVVARWDELIYYLCLELGQWLGANVRRVTPKSERDPAIRRRNASQHLVRDGCLAGTIRIPDTVGDIDIRADLAKRQLAVSVSVQAPTEGRPRTRVNWLLRQLPDDASDLRIDVRFAGRKSSTSNLLPAVRDQVDLALPDPRSEPRAFEVVSIRELGIGRRKGRSGFIDSVSDGVLDFYELVVQGLRPWQRSAPRVAQPAREDSPPASGEPAPPLVRWLQQVQQGEVSADA